MHEWKRHLEQTGDYERYAALDSFFCWVTGWIEAKRAGNEENAGQFYESMFRWLGLLDDRDRDACCKIYQRVRTGNVDAAEQCFLEVIDSMITTKTTVPSKPGKSRYDWDEVYARAIVIFQKDPSKLGMGCAKWARELGIPRTTFSQSPAWERIQALHIVRQK